ncbi:unnamed protein product [Clonostachys rosea]|uniref:Uncharacterized protein n=1 Tax=Bionectria ochroleuca TaxID=29856 RepID=A0ABY6UUN6_BIOOC|nr:unnamed protein product [Clonostachys rosea]
MEEPHRHLGFKILSGGRNSLILPMEPTNTPEAEQQSVIERNNLLLWSITDANRRLSEVETRFRLEISKTKRQHSAELAESKSEIAHLKSEISKMKNKQNGESAKIEDQITDSMTETKKKIGNKMSELKSYVQFEIGGCKAKVELTDKKLKAKLSELEKSQANLGDVIIQAVLKEMAQHQKPDREEQDLMPQLL